MPKVIADIEIVYSKDELLVKQTSFMLQINAAPLKILIAPKFLLKFSF